MKKCLGEIKNKVFRKGQMEMIGLVVIVILITLGMIFAMMFVLKEKPEKKIFTRKGLATSTLAAVMKTSISGYEFGNSGCLENTGSGDDMQLGKDVLENCALNYNTQKELEFYDCLGEHSCFFLNRTINHLLNATVNHWGKRYEVQAYLLVGQKADPIKLLEINHNRCKSKDRDTSGPFPINTPAGMVEILLYICDRS